MKGVEIMAEKIRINNTLATLHNTLFVSEGDFPYNQDGTVTFTLEPGETEIADTLSIFNNKTQPY